jgi:hypothetical protein
MKQNITRVLFGQNNLVSGAIAIAVVASIALGCNCGKGLDFGNTSQTGNSSTTSNSTSDDGSTTASSGEVPSLSTCETMVHDLTSDFAAAIGTNDFSDIHQKASTDFQNTYTEDQMKAAFKTFVDKKRLVRPVLDKTDPMTPDFTPAPYIRTEKGLSILVLNGKFATKPVPMNFEYEFVNRGGEWKMLKLIVKLN